MKHWVMGKGELTPGLRSERGALAAWFLAGLLAVATQAGEPPGAPATAKYELAVGAKGLSLTATAVPASELLRAIADRTGVSIETGQVLAQPVTLQVADLSLELVIGQIIRQARPDGKFAFHYEAKGQERVLTKVASDERREVVVNKAAPLAPPQLALHEINTASSVRPLAAAAVRAPLAPQVAPTIVYPGELDGNRNRVDDLIDLRLADAAALQATDATAATQLRDDPIRIELIFAKPISQAQLDAFLALGGKIDHIYQSVSYGWNGVLPRAVAATMPATYGDSLVIVRQERMARATMDEASRTGRARPVWQGSFTPVGGFNGSSTITIGVLDTGLDDTHTDLNGRVVYWRDFTSKGALAPEDVFGHGTHVAGIAAGTGASFEADSSTLNYTDSGELTVFQPSVTSYLHLPLSLGAFTFNSTATWADGGSTDLFNFRAADGASPSSLVENGRATGPSPLTLSLNLVRQANQRYLAYVGFDGTASYVAIANNVSYAPIGDGFNTLRGVAAGANLAGGKVLGDDGFGSLLEVNAGIDDMVTQRLTHNIKIVNMSLGAGLDSTVRGKVNTAVNNGIVMVVSAGNSGPATDSSSTSGDPASAGKAITVGSANDINELTSYTSVGDANPGSLAESDMKPDLLAPGGSFYHSQILAPDTNTADAGLATFADVQPNDYWNIAGTSMASPFAAGAAALVVEAMERAGIAWDFTSDTHPLAVKMLLTMTATETNAKRESNTGTADGSDPLLGRSASPKDRFEGYGMINPDAAIESLFRQGRADGDGLARRGGVTAGNGGVGFDPNAGLDLTGSSDGARDSQRAWARQIDLVAGQQLTLDLANPATGDFDLYLYSATPDANGNPVILQASSLSGFGVKEAIDFAPANSGVAYLVIKRVAGTGTWVLSTPLGTALTLTLNTTSVAENAGVAAATATVARNTADLSNPLTVTIVGNDSSEAVAAVSSITIPPGQATGTFSINAVDDNILDGAQSVIFTVSAPTFRSASRTLTVNDFEQLVVTFAAGLGDLHEDQGPKATYGTVSRTNDNLGSAITVNLTSSDSAALLVPTSVIIPANHTTASFPVDVVDDDQPDGDVTVTITGSSPGYVNGTNSLTVVDNEGVPQQTLRVVLSPTSIAESAGVGAVVGTLTRENFPDISVPLTVNLSSSDTSELTVAASITIPAGAASVGFAVNAVDDNLVDGPQVVAIIPDIGDPAVVTLAGTILVTDVEELGFVLPDTTFSEASSGIGATASITRSAADRLPLTVTITSSDPSEVLLGVRDAAGEVTQGPGTSITVTLAALASSADFDLYFLDDGIQDGNQRVTLLASGTDYVGDTTSINVLDINLDILTYRTLSVATRAGSRLNRTERTNGITAFQLDGGTLIPVFQILLDDRSRPRTYTLVEGDELAALLASFSVTTDTGSEHSLFYQDGESGDPVINLYLAVGAPRSVKLVGSRKVVAPTLLRGALVDYTDVLGTETLRHGKLTLRLDPKLALPANRSGFGPLGLRDRIVADLETRGYERAD